MKCLGSVEILQYLIFLRRSCECRIVTEMYFLSTAVELWDKKWEKNDSVNRGTL